MKRMRLQTLISLACVVSLTACVSAPRGPHVAVMPAPGKSLEVFQQEDLQCRNYASQSIGNQSPADTVVGSAIVGTVFGAAIGAALGGRHGAGSGAATGLMVGTVAGAGAGASEGYSAQRRYDIAYQQCMTTMQNNTASHTTVRKVQVPATPQQQPQSPNVVVIPPPPATPTPAPLPVPAPASPSGGYYPPPPGVQPPPPM